MEFSRGLLFPRRVPSPLTHPATGPAGGVEILALCEWRLAILGVGAARRAQLVGVDAMSISECHAMVGRCHGMAWHADRYPGISGTLCI